METRIEGAPSFAYLHVDLDPGESLVAEADAMASMDAKLDMQARLNGNFFMALAKRLLANESLFVNVFTNNTRERRRVTLVQPTPGDLKELAMHGATLCLQPGAFLAATPDVKIGVAWAGFASFIGGEGLFKLVAGGRGTLWFGAYGGILYKEVRGSYIVDSNHLVAYEPQLKLNVQLAGGIFSSFFGGEGIVLRVEGQGKIAIQTRSLEGLRDYLNPRLL